MIGDRGRIVRRGQGRCDVRCTVGQGDNAPVITVSEITSATRSVGALAVFSFSQKWAVPTETSGSAVVIASTGEMRMPSRKAFWLNRKPTGPTMPGQHGYQHGGQEIADDERLDERELADVQRHSLQHVVGDVHCDRGEPQRPVGPDPLAGALPGILGHVVVLC